VSHDFLFNKASPYRFPKLETLEVGYHQWFKEYYELVIEAPFLKRFSLRVRDNESKISIMISNFPKLQNISIRCKNLALELNDVPELSHFFTGGQLHLLKSDRLESMKFLNYLVPQFQDRTDVKQVEYLNPDIIRTEMNSEWEWCEFSTNLV
jgi:hypothetical protein